MSSPRPTVLIPENIPRFHSLVRDFNITQRQTRPTKRHHPNVPRLKNLKTLIDRQGHSMDDALQSKILSRLKMLDIQDLVSMIQSSPPDPQKKLYLQNLDKIQKSLALMKQLEDQLVALFMSTIDTDDLLAMYARHNG